MLSDYFDCRDTFPAKLRLSLFVFGGLTGLIGLYTLGVNYLAVSGYGSWEMTSLELVGWLCLIGLSIMGLALVGILFQRLRCTAAAILIGAGLFVTVTLASLWCGDRIRYQGFARLAAEAAPLVAAIKTYEAEHGMPPEDLSVLKVDYPADHRIRGGRLPAFEYLSGYMAKERYHGNPWVLKLQTPTGPLRWDLFIYYPLQNYPSLGHGGWFEPIADWAYVHE